MKEYYSKNTPKSSIYNLIIIGFIFSSIVYFLSDGIDNISLNTIGILILFWVFIIFGIFNAKKNKPTLVIDENGITDNSTLNNCGFINWDHIKNIEIRKGVNMTFLCFDLIDDSKILSLANPIKKSIMKSNKRKLGTICVIPEVLINENLDIVLNEINHHKSKYP